MTRIITLITAAGIAFISVFQGLGSATAQGVSGSPTALDLRQALAAARMQQRSARLRAEQLEAETQRAESAALRARTRAAGIAARVQQAEARVAGAQTELAIAADARRALEKDLALRRAPLAGLTASLGTMVRRPATLWMLQPGSLHDIAHVRAILEGTWPHIRQRTADLRGQLAEARQLEAQTNTHLAQRREAEAALSTRRRELLAIAETERVRALRATGAASREAARARALARQARDLDALVAGLSDTAPDTSSDAPVRRRDSAQASPAPGSGVADYILPVSGRIAMRFGQGRTGMTFDALPGALVVAPADGRIAFAGPYEGYATIVIVDHGAGWTSLLTGLASSTVATGQSVSGGSPLGRASTSRPQVGLELRRGRRAIDPQSVAREP